MDYARQSQEYLRMHVEEKLQHMGLRRNALTDCECDEWVDNSCGRNSNGGLGGIRCLWWACSN